MRYNEGDDLVEQMARREFIEVSAASVMVTRAGKTLTQASEPTKPWYATMRRCGQLNFNGRDPLTLNSGAWMDYWASLKVNAILLNGGGIVAFYPTKIPYQQRTEFPGARDMFGDRVAAARKRGIRVVPEWIPTRHIKRRWSLTLSWFLTGSTGLNTRELPNGLREARA